MIRFAKLEEKHLELVMSWRANPEVAKHMFTDIEQDIEKQRTWFHKISLDDSYRYWVILYNEIPIGLVNLAEIDWKNRRCTAGYYIGDMSYRSLGGVIPPYLYNYVFKVLKFKKIYGEVIAENANILKIHELHGYRQVGVCKEHVLKDGHFHDVIFIELLADSWLEKKRYQRDIVQFD